MIMKPDFLIFTQKLSVKTESFSVASEAYGQFFDMISLVMTVAGVLIVLLTQVWWSAILIVLLSLPLFSIAVKSGKASYEANREVEKYNRKVNYLYDVLNGRDSVEERTLFGYSSKVNDQWYD